MTPFEIISNLETKEHYHFCYIYEEAINEALKCLSKRNFKKTISKNGITIRIERF